MTAPDPPAVASVGAGYAAFFEELVAERGLTHEVIRDAIANAIPNRLFDSPVVGVGGARRQKVADCAMTVVAAALPHLRAQVLAEVDAALRDGKRYLNWLQTTKPFSALDDYEPFSLASIAARYLRDTLARDKEDR